MRVLGLALAGALALTVTAAQAAPLGSRMRPDGAGPAPGIVRVWDGDRPGWRGNLAAGHRRSQAARDRNTNRAGTLERDGSPREQGRPAPDAVKPADLAQAAGAFRAPDVAECR